MRKGTTLITLAGAILVSTVAWAGPLETARGIDQQFDNAILACKPDTAVELFDDDALAIFPGQGEMERGKVAIARLINNFSKAFCPNDLKQSTLKDASFAATPLGPDYVMIVRVIDATDKNGARAQFRATELIHQTRGKWRYLVDHVSVGLEPANESDKPGP
jgi:ketosteroid isomerase-like protein